MESLTRTATKKEAARCNRATPARKSNDVRVKGSRTKSIPRRQRQNKHQIERAALSLALLLVLIGIIYTSLSQATTIEQPAAVPLPTEATEITEAPAETPAPSDSAGTPAVDPPAPRYELSASERDLVERVVMAEAGGEPFKGQMLVAQCILNAAEKTGTAPSEVVGMYQYTNSRPEPTESVRDAVAAVFDQGEAVTGEPILYFYNPAIVASHWHESQIFVIEVGGHRFFAEKGATD